MLGRKLAFWAGVAGVSILSQFGWQLLTQKVPSLGLQRFTNFTYNSGNGAA